MRSIKVVPLRGMPTMKIGSRVVAPDGAVCNRLWKGFTYSRKKSGIAGAFTFRPHSMTFRFPATRWLNAAASSRKSSTRPTVPNSNTCALRYLLRDNWRAGFATYSGDCCPVRICAISPRPNGPSSSVAAGSANFIFALGILQSAGKRQRGCQIEAKRGLLREQRNRTFKHCYGAWCARCRACTPRQGYRRSSHRLDRR